MEDDSIENCTFSLSSSSHPFLAAPKIQSKFSSRPRDRSRDRKHRKRSSSSGSSSSSRSRERSSKRRRDDRKKRSSKYSSASSSSSSSSSRSRSRSSSSSRSRSRSNSLRQKIKRKSNFDDDRPSGNKYPQNFTENRSFSSSNNNNFNQYPGGSGGFRVADLIPGRGGQPSSFMNKPKFGSSDDRHAKKLYFGNLPQNINESDFIEYIYRSLELAGGVMQPGNPITGIKYEHDKNYIFLDFRSIEETSACLQLDGITYVNLFLKGPHVHSFYKLGKVLRIKRPKQYDLVPKPENTRPIPILDLMKLGTRFVSPKVDNSSTKVFVGGIPHHMEESAIIEILMRAGPLKSFHLVKDRANISKGFGFCEYHTEQDVAKCIETLNGLSMGIYSQLSPLTAIGHQRILQVKRAFNLSERDFLGPSSNAASNLARNFLDMFNSASNPQAAAFQQQPPLGQFGNYQNNDFNNMNPIQPQINEAPPVVEEKATNVICISNMVDPNELEDDAEFEDIYEDIQNEVVRFGPVRSIMIPRKKDGFDGSCLGKVYIEYEDAKSAISAKSVLKTYKFGGNNLDPIYYEPNQFMERILL